MLSLPLKRVNLPGSRTKFGFVRAQKAATEAEPIKRRSLNLAGTRALGKQSLNGLSGFRATFLLQFINPIGDGLNHFARSLRRGVFLGDGLWLTPPLVFLDDFDSFLF